MCRAGSGWAHPIRAPAGVGLILAVSGAVRTESCRRLAGQGGRKDQPNVTRRAATSASLSFATTALRSDRVWRAADAPVVGPRCTALFKRNGSRAC